jgi:tetratricopeptide (TPR) repeat protein
MPRRPLAWHSLPLWIASLAVLAAMLPAPARAHDTLAGEIAAASRAVDGHAGAASTILRRGELHRLAGDWAAAAADYDRAARLDPTLSDVDLARAALGLDAGRPDRAVAVLDAYLGRRPDDARAHELAARAKLALSRPRDALVHLDRAVAIVNHLTPDLLVWRARLADSLDGPERALLDIDEGIARLGGAPALVLEAIRLESVLSRFEPALARLDALGPKWPRADRLARRAELLSAAGRYDEARLARAAALAELESLPEHRRTDAVRAEEAALRRDLESAMPSGAQESSGRRR